MSAPTPEQTKAICDLMEKSGMRVSQCATLAGISKDCVDRWLGTGFLFAGGLVDESQITDDERACQDFLLAVRDARKAWVAYQLELLRWAQGLDPP